MIEDTIKKQIRLDLGKDPDVKLFTNPSGNAWLGGNVLTKENLTLIKDARRVEFGLCKGSSDLIGWRSITITPDMVGKTFARFLAIEVKTASGRPTAEQTNFIDQVRKAGGLAGIARSAEEARGIIAEYRSHETRTRAQNKDAPPT